VDADLDRNAASRAEHVRRLGEVANIILDAGMILIASAAELTSEELHVIRTSAGPDRVVTSWVGSPSPADMDADLFLEVSGDLRCDTARLRRRLEDMGAFGRRGEGNGDGP
jgi:bifunctional enzyme CysN/CysC